MRHFQIVILAIFPLHLIGQTCSGGNCTAASVSTSDVQACINSTTAGNTCTIPAGSATWTSGVTISGKGITVNGAGSGRIAAYSFLSSPLSIGTGTKSLTVTGFAPGFSGSNLTNGATVKIFEDYNAPNFMQGTITSYSGSTLTINATSSGGSCGSQNISCKQWLIAIIPASRTVITNSYSGSTPLFSVTEDSTYHTNIGNIQIVPGTVSQKVFNVSPNGTTPQAVLIHDMWIEDNGGNPGPSDGDATMIEFNTSSRGVAWNISSDVYPWNQSTVGTIGWLQLDQTYSNWASAALWGNLDTSGQGNGYIETSFFSGMNYTTSTDDNGRMVTRYNVYDASGIGTHGADSSPFGQRLIDAYNNTFLFTAYPDCTEPNLQNWFLVRGGTFLFHNNTVNDINTGSCYGVKSNIVMTVQNLQRNAGPNPCWGAGHGSPAGQNYFAPRQVGMGYVTGTGTTAYTGVSPNPVYTVSGSTYAPGFGFSTAQYVGDSEPAYIWGNTSNPLNNVSIEDYGGTDCSNPDTSANYIQSSRDYFNGTAKSGYTPATYPNVLEGGGTTYTLTVTATNGSVSGTNCASGTYAAGTSIGACTASPNSGYTFTGWTGTGAAVGCSGTGACGPFPMNANGSLVAAFMGTVVNPAFTPTPGSYSSSQSVTIATSTPGATLCYTTDGSTPTTNGAGGCVHGTTYSGAVTVSSTTTLKAIGTESGFLDSGVTTGTYTITPQAATPTFSPVAGTYGPVQSIIISTTTTGATICYTADGSTPTANGAGICTHGSTYSSAVTVATSQTLKSIASKSGFGDSATGSAAYVITNGYATTPTFSPVAGSYGPAQSVTTSTASSPCSSYLYTDTNNPPTTPGNTATVSVSETLYSYVHNCPSWSDSPVASAAYVINGAAATPTFSPTSRSNPGWITLACATPSPTIYYTTDGSAPTTSSAVYNHHLYIGQSQTVKAICTAPSYTSSAVASQAYSFTRPKTRFSLSTTSSSTNPVPFPLDNRACCGSNVAAIEGTRGTYSWTVLHNWITQSTTNGSTFWYTIQGFPTWMTGQGVVMSAPPTDLNTSAACQNVLTGTTTTDCSMKEFVTALMEDRTGLSSQPANPTTCSHLDYLEIINEFNTDDASGSTGWTGTYADLATLANDISGVVHAWCSNTILVAGSASGIVGFHSNGENAHFDVALETLLADWGGISNASLPDMVSFHAYPARGTVSPVPFPTSIVSNSDASCTSGNTPNVSCYISVATEASTIQSGSVLQNSAIAPWAANLLVASSEGGFGTQSQLSSLSSGSTLASAYVAQYLITLAYQNVPIAMLYAANDSTWGCYWNCGSGTSAWLQPFNTTSTWLANHAITGSLTSTSVSGGNVWKLPLDSGAAAIWWFDGYLTTSSQATTFNTYTDSTNTSHSTSGTILLSQQPVLLTNTSLTAPTISGSVTLSGKVTIQ